MTVSTSPLIKPSSLCVSVSSFISLIRTLVTGFRAQCKLRVISSWDPLHNYICKDPISKQGHIQRHWGLGLGPTFWVIIQYTTDRYVKIPLLTFYFLLSFLSPSFADTKWNYLKVWWQSHCLFCVELIFLPRCPNNSFPLKCNDFSRIYIYVNVECLNQFSQVHDLPFQYVLILESFLELKLYFHIFLFHHFNFVFLPL